MPRTLTGALLAAILTVASGASAQDWPTRPVTLVVPFAAGGPIDVVARIISPRLSRAARPAGGGRQRPRRRRHGGREPGREGRARRLHVPARQPGDPHLQPVDLQEAALQRGDRLRRPPACVVSNTKVLVARKDLPVDTLAQFIAYAKANQAKHAIRLRRRRLGDPHRLRAAQRQDRAPASRMCPIAAPARRCRT